MEFSKLVAGDDCLWPLGFFYNWQLLPNLAFATIEYVIDEHLQRKNNLKIVSMRVVSDGLVQGAP